jgi:hypothetical protein
VVQIIWSIALDIASRFIIHHFNRTSQDPTLETAVNVNEVEIFFNHIQRPDAPVRTIIPYLNRNYGDLAQIKQEIIAVYDLSSYPPGETITFIPVIIVGRILTIHGIHKPDEIIEIILDILEIKDKRLQEERQIHFIGVLKDILMHQKKIEERWINTLRFLTRLYIDNCTQGYGVAISSSDTYQYFPLMWYSQVWHKWNPRQPVDLIEQYLRKAEIEDIRALTLHILRGFADPRFGLSDYRMVLNFFTAYLTAKDAEFQAATIKSLAHIRGKQQQQVDEYLNTISTIQQDIIEQIKTLSYEESIQSIAVGGMGDLITSLLAYTPPDKLTWLFRGVEAAYRSKNARTALKALFSEYLYILAQ